jgi:GntR family transcriptional regulator/MocR family aminotransferase
MASDDPAEIIIYTSTFSKVLFPSLRLGFLAIPDALCKELAKLRRLSTHQNDGLTQRAIANWMANGSFERHLRKSKRIYHRRRDYMEQCLLKLRESGCKIDWHTPQGGMAFWLNTFKDSTQLSKNALENQIFVMPEQSYRLDKKTGTHLRIGFSNQNEHEIKAGLTNLSKVILRSTN